MPILVLALALAFATMPAKAKFVSSRSEKITSSHNSDPLRASANNATSILQSYDKLNSPKPMHREVKDFFPSNSNSLKPSAFTATVNVTTLADSGTGSLRNAILTANGSMTPTEIDFTVTGRISLQTLLPSISKPVFINGGSAPGFIGSPKIALDGFCAANPFGAKNGLFFETNAGSSIVRGLAFHDFETNGCTSSAGGPGIMGANAGNVLVSECDFGQTSDFLSVGSGSNFSGIIPGAGWTIAFCIITGNSHGGINIQNNINAVRVQSSLIGLDAYNLGLGNGLYGISVGASNVTIANCIISGSANGLYGADVGPGISLSGSNAVITSNFIGTDQNGAGARPNLDGIVISNANHASILNNLISGNQGNGIRLGNGVSDITIQGNNIGTNFPGTYAI